MNLIRLFHLSLWRFVIIEVFFVSFIKLKAFFLLLGLLDIFLQTSDLIIILICWVFLKPLWLLWFLLIGLQKNMGFLIVRLCLLFLGVCLFNLKRGLTKLFLLDFYRRFWRFFFLTFFCFSFILFFMIDWKTACKNSSDFAGFTSFSFKLNNPVSGFLYSAYHYRNKNYVGRLREFSLPRISVSKNFVRLIPSQVKQECFCERSIRSSISSFSPASRSRFQLKLEGFSHLGWSDFVTLTFRTKRVFMDSVVRLGASCDSGEMQDMKYCYALLKSFVRSVDYVLQKKFGRKSLWAWKREFQANGTVHYHLMSTMKLRFRYRGRSFVRYMEKLWFRLTGNDSKNSVDLAKIRSRSSASWYMAKYISKSDKKNNDFCCSAPLSTLVGGFVGRWWGFFNESLYKSFFRFPRVFRISRLLFSRLYSLCCGLSGREVDWQNVRCFTFYKKISKGSKMIDYYSRFIKCIKKFISEYGFFVYHDTDMDNFESVNRENARSFLSLF